MTAAPWVWTPATIGALASTRAVVELPGGEHVEAVDLTADPLGWMLAPALAQVVPLVRGRSSSPGIDTIALAQAETVAPVESTHTITLTAAGNAGPFVWELARFVVGWNELFTLERLATYLRLTDAQGAVVFITNQGSDPFAVLQVGGTVLRVRWILDVSRTDNTAGAFLLAAPPAFLPLGGPLGGIPRQWRDLRYSWGQRSQEGHQGTVTGPAQVRFFVELETVGDDTLTATAGAMLSGFTVAGGGPTHAATRAATTRRN